MHSSLFFKIKDSVGISNSRLLEIFIDDWVDTTCRDHDRYKILECAQDPAEDSKLFRIDFTKQEDAVALKLKGLPPRFSKYIEFV